MIECFLCGDLVASHQTHSIFTDRLICTACNQELEEAAKRTRAWVMQEIVRSQATVKDEGRTNFHK